MPKFHFKVEDGDGNLLREGTGLFVDRNAAKRVLLEREERRSGSEHAGEVKVNVSEVKG